MDSKIALTVLLSTLLVLNGCDSFHGEKKEADQMADQISTIIQKLEEMAVNTAEEIKPYFETPEQYKEGLFENEEYTFYKEAVYHNPVDQGHGKFIYTGYFAIGENEREKLKVMENVIPHLRKLVEDSEYSRYVGQGGLVTFDSLIVLYPWVDLTGSIVPKQNMMDDDRWKSLSKKQNLRRELKWTEPYQDKEGLGLMAALLIPVDNGNFMEAFLSVGIIFRPIKEDILDASKEGYLLVERKSSRIIVANREGTTLLNLERTTRALYGETRESDLFYLTPGDKSMRVYRKEIDGPGWDLILLRMK